MKIKITAISDLHGHFPVLKGGDLLIIAGDLTARHTVKEMDDFWRWVCYQDYKKTVIVAGNHDQVLEKAPDTLVNAGADIHYLKDSGIQYRGLKIWGTPWSLYAPFMEPNCVAFTSTERGLKAHYDQIPEQTDILISHSPFAACLDRVKTGSCVGSDALRDAVERVKPKLFICGHIHEAHGYCLYKHWGPNTHCYNVSIMDELYRPVNSPTEIEIEVPE